jgi:hypothetical protein
MKLISSQVEQLAKSRGQVIMVRLLPNGWPPASARSNLNGWRRFAAEGLNAGFLAGVSPVIHDFWRVEDPERRMNEMTNFTKNMAVMGGALSLMGVDEPWPSEHSNWPG